MFTGRGNVARDDHEQAAAVAANMGEEETRAGQVPSRSTKYNLADSPACSFVYRQTLPDCGLFR